MPEPTKDQLKAEIEALKAENEQLKANIPEGIDIEKLGKYLENPSRVEFVATGYYVVDDVKYTDQDIADGKVAPQIVEAIEEFKDAWGWLKDAAIN